MRTFWIASLGCLALWAHAQPADPVFRERVIQLALLYGDSSGIDPNDYKVVAREVKKIDAQCSDVEVVTTKGEAVVLRTTVRACRPARDAHAH